MLLRRLLVEVAADEGRPVVARFSDGTWQQLPHRLNVGAALAAMLRSCEPQPAGASTDRVDESDAGACCSGCMSCI